MSELARKERDRPITKWFVRTFLIALFLFFLFSIQIYFYDKYYEHGYQDAMKSFQQTLDLSAQTGVPFTFREGRVFTVTKGRTENRITYRVYEEQ